MIACPRLVVCDLDGTLVDSEKRLRPATIAAVARLCAAGIGFAVISARPRSGVLPVIKTLELDGVHAAFNGGTLFDRGGAIVGRATIDEDVVRGMFGLACQIPVEPWVFAADRWYASRGEGMHTDRERRSSSQEPIVTADFARLLGDVDKLTFVSDDEPLLQGLRERARAHFGDRATIAQSQTYYLDVTALAGNKGDGIRALASSRGIPLGETVAIGDQANDIAMFDAAGFSIAVGNAPGAVKQRVDAVTASNDADGVARAIDTLILRAAGRRPVE